VFAAVDLHQRTDMGLALASLAVARTATTPLPLAVGDEPTAQGFVIEVLAVALGQFLGSQGGAEACPPWWVGVVGAVQRKDGAALAIRFAARRGTPAQAMDQARVAHA